jgi:hypothetical protein
MGHYCALVVRHESDSKAVSDTLAELTKLQLVQNATDDEPAHDALRVQIELPESVYEDPGDTERRIQKVSKKFGLHVTLVLAVSASDSFLYVHWYAGRIVRALACGVEEDAMWTRVVGEPEDWEAEAFEGEEVTGKNGKPRVLGRDANGRFESPRRGDLSLPPDAMKYAELALLAS